MATKPKKSASYDLKAADRRRNVMIQVGLTAIVVIFAVVLVLYIVMSGDKKPVGGETKSIRVASSKLITKEGTTEPKAVVSLYEDFLCPVCGQFEQQFGPTLTQMINTGAIAADYNMVAILDRPANQNYSSRASSAAYCVADEDKTPDKQFFTRFHAALYAQQPSETGTSFPNNAQLIETARQAGVVGKVPECINSGRYLDLATGLAGASKVTGTPTVRINGEDYTFSTPDALVAKIKGIVGDVPGLAVAPAAPAPTAPDPAQAPAAAPGAASPTPASVTVAATSETASAEPAERPSSSPVRTASAIWVLVAGAVGLIAAVTLTIEKIKLLENPAYVPSCSINPVLSCGSVMVTPQAAEFGFPNSLIGVVAFSVVLVTGVLAVAKVALPQWFWAGLAAGTLLGVVFIHWLILQSLYVIGALCPYCMVVWAVTIPLLAVVSSIALRPLADNGFARLALQWRWSLVALWFTALILLILVRFWNYWSTLL